MTVITENEKLRFQYLLLLLSLSEERSKIVFEIRKHEHEGWESDYIKQAYTSRLTDLMEEVKQCEAMVDTLEKVAQVERELADVARQKG